MPILWPPDAKNWLTGKVPDDRKEWGQEKGTTDDKMVGWHHWLNGHEFEQAPRVGDGQGCLVCCCPRGRKESDTTEWLGWTEHTESSIGLLHGSWSHIGGSPSSCLTHSTCKEPTRIWFKNQKSWMIMNEPLILIHWLLFEKFNVNLAFPPFLPWCYPKSNKVSIRHCSF